MSLKAIAAELGISVTTVSRALGGFSDVSASTRARVEAEARRRGYRPNTPQDVSKPVKPMRSAWSSLNMLYCSAVVCLWIWSVVSAGNWPAMILTYC